MFILWSNISSVREGSEHFVHAVYDHDFNKTRAQTCIVLFYS